MLALTLALALAPAVIDAPVTNVTVFSDRARVTRTATLSLSGTERVPLPLLPDSIDASSVRVEASGGEVKRVEIAHVNGEEFPIDEAKKLLAEIEALDDKIDLVTASRDAAHSLAQSLRGIAPSPPQPEPARPVPRLNPAGWSAGFAFIDGWLDRMQAKVRNESEKLIDLGKERRELADKARILGGAQRRSGWRLTALVAGSGRAKLTVTYMAVNARWTPRYDIQLLPDQKNVLVSLAGLVSQETGEDWEEAALVLSTAMPATATVMPKLFTWKIGERDRFIPTPTPVAEMVPPPPPMKNASIQSRLRSLDREVAVLQRNLAVLADSRGAKGKNTTIHLDSDDIVEGDLARPDGDYKAESKEPVASPPPPPPPVAMDKPAPAEAMPMPEAAAEAPMAREESAAPARSRSFWGGKKSAAPASPSAGATVALDEVTVAGAVAAQGVGLAPPPGWTPPYFGPDLPVTLAGGYDLQLRAVRRETIQSGKGARRVALLAQKWPVEVERRIYPALAGEAYVTAEMKNPSQQALPGGPAELAVGDDPAGNAKLSVMAPGEKFTLPLGLDRALKPVRNVQLVQTQKGVFSKDDVGDYAVTIEIANPYRAPVALRVFDQLPLSNDKNVEIKAGRFEPAPVEQEATKGSIEWRVTVPAAGKSVIKFNYTIRRPKGWLLHQ